MRRGLMAWDKGEIPIDVLKNRVHGLQAAIAMSRRSLVDTISSQTAAFSTELAATRELIDRHASEIIKQLKRQ